MGRPRGGLVDEVNDVDVVVDAVEQEVVRSLERRCYRERATRSVASARHRHNSRRKPGQVSKFPLAAQRQVTGGLGLYGLAYDGAFGLQGGRGRGDLDRFRHGSNLQSDVCLDAVTGCQGDVALNARLEAGCLDVHTVNARLQRWANVVTAGVGLYFVCQTGSVFGDSDFRAGEDAAGRVRHSADYGA
jgi:hypothetical protein